MKGIPYLLLAEVGFSLKTEFADFLLLKEADDEIDTVGSPPGNLVLEPVARTRAGHDCQPSGHRQVDPIDLLAHRHSLWTGVSPRPSRSAAYRPQPVGRRREVWRMWVT